MGKYQDATPFGRGRAMRQTPSDMRRSQRARPLRLKGEECKCVVYACVLYRSESPDTRAVRIPAVTCVNGVRQPQGIVGVVDRIVDVTQCPAYTRRSRSVNERAPDLNRTTT